MQNSNPHPTLDQNQLKTKFWPIFEFFSPGIPIILKNAGCEFVIFDMEHGGLSLEQFKTLSLISNANKIPPFIRIPELNYNYIARALDLGASGVMVPMVNTADDAIKIVIKPWS